MAAAGQQQQNVVEVLDRDSGSDSAYTDDDYRSYASTLTSSVENYQWIGGRRFHAYREGTYNFPNDEEEQDRLDLFHGIFTLRIDGKLHLAPVKEPSRILDIGTGTGIWAIEAADKYENAQVYANDLSPIQPKWVPPNLTFEVDDVESDWPPRPPFDLIHSRYMAGSIADWPRLMQQAYTQTSNGGWAEFQDLDLHNYSEDNSIPAGNKVLELYKHIIQGCEQVGRTACPGPNLKRWMEEAGFRNVTEHILKLPLGPWPRDMTLRRIGAANLTQMLDGLDAFSVALFTKVLGWKVEEVQLFLREVREDAKRKSVHMIHHFHVVYGQRVD
ncbi:hypothetical protein AC578_1636 [Pseudocercospora eumusae]|uniref:Methyltransferase domain-containing protein n=1 Tax=Pseudocercospora eumusae TaxID=321146 RepID=A0A139HLU2_9PEZI|nr:hypothetical protein AC578_1636 [Pseudocercospora eumusae]